MAAALAAGMSALVVPTTSDAAGVTTRSVTKVHGQYLTTYHWASGGTTKILDLRSGRVGSATAPVAHQLAATATSPAKTVYQGGFDLAPDSTVTAGNKVASLDTPVLNTSDAAMVQALGAPSDVVAQFAAQDRLDGTTVASSPAMTTTAALIKKSSTVRTATTATTATTGSLYNRTCAGGHFDNDQGGYYACWNQYLEHAYAGGNWYMADHFYSSGYMHDTAIFNPDEITGLQQGVHYGSYNAMIDWQPKNTVTGGNCTQTTVSVGGFGQTYSTTYTRCPEVYGLHYISQWTFQTKWDGQGSGPNNGSRDTSGVDTVHSPGSASPSRGTSLHYWWE